MIKVTLNGVTFSVPEDSRVLFASADGVEAVEMSADDAFAVLRATNPIDYPRPMRMKKP